MSFRLTPAAESDIEAIATYIAGDSPAAARMGRWHRAPLRPDKGTCPAWDLRFVPVGNYLILHRQVGDDVEIVRVLHSARRWQELL